MKSEILELIYKNLFHNRTIYIWEDEDQEAGDSDVTKNLIKTYMIICNNEEKNVQTLSGSQAEQYMRGVYMSQFTEEEQKGVEENYSWPDELPYDLEIPKFIISNMAKRMAKYDKFLQKEFKSYADKRKEEANT